MKNPFRNKKKRRSGAEERLKRIKLQKNLNALFQKIILEKDKHSLWYIFWNMEKEGLRPKAWEELKKIGFSCEDIQKLYDGLNKISGEIGSEIESFFIEIAPSDSLFCALQFKKSSDFRKKCFIRLEEKFQEGFIGESHFKSILINLLEQTNLTSLCFERLRKLHLSSTEIDEIAGILQNIGDQKMLKEIRKLRQRKEKSMKVVMEIHKILKTMEELKGK